MTDENPLKGRTSDSTILARPNELILPRFRSHEYTVALWLDSTIDESEKDTNQSIQKLQRIVNVVKRFKNIDECIDFLTDLNNDVVFLIISNHSDEWIFSLIDSISQLRAIYLYDRDQMQLECKIKAHQKVQGVFTSIDSICHLLKHGIYKFETDQTSISIIRKSSSKMNFNELDQSFMYSQILKEILLEIKYDEKAKQDFVEFCRKQYADNEIQLNIINNFESDYEFHPAIWWYTKEPFIYRTLNYSLRTQDVEMIIKMGFFLQDLHRQIERIYREHPMSTQIIIYRGQGMMNTEFENLKNSPGGLLSFNNFLSTSLNREISLVFARSVQDDPALTGILFQIQIDPSISSTPFAALDDTSFYLDMEKEILFSMHTIFRISDIIQLEDRLWQISLTSTKDNDQQLVDLAVSLRNEIGQHSGWIRMAGLMIKMGKFRKAINIYNTLLNAMTHHEAQQSAASLPIILNNNATACASLGDYRNAMEYAKMTLELMQTFLSSNHPYFASIYNNIGTIYQLRDDISNAFLYYEKAIEVLQNCSSIEFILDLSASYRNLGDLHYNSANYVTALSFYEKSLEIDQKYLSSIHPDLALGYFNIGRVQNAMGNYENALSFVKKTLDIEIKSLPPSHAHLATTYALLGETYRSLGKYSDALSYYEKTVKIEEKALPSNHPQLAATFNNLGEIYRTLEDYSTALTYYQKSLEIEQNSSSSNQTTLVATYNNIGLVHEAIGDYSTALSYLKKSLELEENNLSPNHPDLAITYSDIAGLYQSMKDYSTALSYYEKTLKIQQKSLDSNHPELAITYNDMGLVYKSMEDYPTALAYYEKALEIQNVRLPADHPHTAVTYKNLGDLNVLTENYSNALLYYEKAIDIKQKSLPSNHSSLADIYYTTGEIYRATEQYSLALTYYEKSFHIRLTSLPSDSLEIANIYSRIGLVYKVSKNYSNALLYYQKTLEIQEKHLTFTDIELGDTYEVISELYSLLGDYSTALSHYKKSMEIAQNCLSPDDPSLITRFYNLSVILDQLSRYSEAMEYAQKAVSIADQTSEADDSELEDIEEHINSLREKLS